MITEALHNIGNWSLQLEEDAPLSLASAFDELDHLVILPTDSDVTALSDATILASALYTGVCTKADQAGRNYAGYGLGWWLGSPSGVGPQFATTTNATSGGGEVTFGNVFTQMTGARLTLTDATAAIGLGATPLPLPPYVTYREIIDALIVVGGGQEVVGYKISPAGTLTVDEVSALFVTTPTVVVTRRGSSTTGAYRGIDGDMATSVDVEEYTTKVVAALSAIESVSSGGAGTYRDLAGNLVTQTRAINASSDTAENAQSKADSLTAELATVRRETTLSSETHTITRFVTPGDYVWVFDLDSGLVDTANQIEHDGQIMSPRKLRVYALTWPIERGMGVFARKSTGVGTATYTRLTDYVQWESDGETAGSVSWEVGAVRQVFTGAQSLGEAARFGSNPQIAASIAGQNAWASFTCTITATSVDPNLGASPIKDCAVSVDPVGTVNWRAYIEPSGAGIATGTGSYTITVPYNSPAAYGIVGTGWIYNGAFHPVVLNYDSTGKARMIRTTDGAIIGSTNVPVIAGWILSIAGTYEAA